MAIKSSNTSGTPATIFTIDPGDIGINLPDGKMWVSDGVSVHEIGANLLNLSVGGSITANGSVGAAGQVLTSGGSGANAYWSTVSGGSGSTGPAFRAYASVDQAITTGSSQKVTFGAETFDTDGNFASSRFTPTTAGYYQLNATVRFANSNVAEESVIILYKNGVEYARGSDNLGGTQLEVTEFGPDAPAPATKWFSISVSDVAYANGSGDYFEIYVQQNSGETKNITSGQTISYFSGGLVRSA